ncbi:MAG TPA: hypothetical protein VIN73_09070 [Vicingaceae bacterium]
MRCTVNGENPAIVYYLFEGIAIAIGVTTSYFIAENVVDNATSLMLPTYSFNPDFDWQRRRERAEREEQAALAAAAKILTAKWTKDLNPGDRDPNQNLDPNGKKGKGGAIFLGALALFKEAYDVLNNDYDDYINKRNELVDKKYAVLDNAEISDKDKTHLLDNISKELKLTNEKIDAIKLAKTSIINKTGAELEYQKMISKGEAAEAGQQRETVVFQKCCFR